MLDAHGDHDALDDLRPVVPRRRRRRRAAGGARRARGAEPQGATSSTSPTPPAATRRLALPVSPRATLALLRASRARAAAAGRAYVVPDDIKALAEPGARPPAPRHARGAARRHPPADALARRSAPSPSPPARDGDSPGAGLEQPRVADGRHRGSRHADPAWLVAGGRRRGRFVAGRLFGLVELLPARRRRSSALLAARRRPGRSHPPASSRSAASSPPAGCTPASRPGSSCRRQPRRPGDAGPAPPRPGQRHAGRHRPARPRRSRAVTVRSAYRLPTERRGLIAVGPLAVVVADPFGLAAVRAEAAPRTELTVLPRVDDILPPPPSGGDEPLAGVRQTHAGGVGRRRLRRPARVRRRRRPPPGPLAVDRPPRRPPGPPGRGALAGPHHRRARHPRPHAPRRRLRARRVGRGVDRRRRRGSGATSSASSPPAGWDSGVDAGQATSSGCSRSWPR